MRNIITLSCVLLIVSGCSSERIEKDGSLTIKLRDGFSQHHNQWKPGSTSPIKIERLEWEYEPNQEKRSERDRKTENTKEALKNAADDVGEEIVGQIFVSLFEIVIKGTVELIAHGIQGSIDGLSDDDVMIRLKSDNGEFTKTAKEGFNRWKLSNSEKVVLQNAWGIQVWSTNKYLFAVTTAPIDDIILSQYPYIEIELKKDGSIGVNGVNKF